jgi:hypothetical protein
VLQVVQVAKTDTFTTTSTSFVDITGFEASITPSATANKILITWSFHYSQTNDGYPAHFVLTDSSNNVLLQGDANGNRTRVTTGSHQFGNSRTLYNSSGSYLWSPSSTSSQTVKWRASRTGVNGAVTFNRTGSFDDTVNDPAPASTITLMEIAG